MLKMLKNLVKLATQNPDFKKTKALSFETIINVGSRFKRYLKMLKMLKKSRKTI